MRDRYDRRERSIKISDPTDSACRSITHRPPSVLPRYRPTYTIEPHVPTSLERSKIAGVALVTGETAGHHWLREQLEDTRYFGQGSE